MARFAYRAVDADARATSGSVEAETRAFALQQVRGLGLSPLEVSESAATIQAPSPVRINGAMRSAVTKAISQIAVLLQAGLQLDRALTLSIENIEDIGAWGGFSGVLKDVKQGVPLSRAMAARGAMFPPMASAMAEAGEADGRLGDALERLAQTLNRSEEVRRLVVTSMIYPIILVVISLGVILMMLLFVVPQFESLFAGAGDKLPTASRAVMQLSQGLRSYGLYILAGIVAAIFLGRQMLRQPGARQATDRLLLRLPQIGTLIRYIETARFSRTLGVLVDGGVPLPNAVGMARRTISNVVMGDAVSQVAATIKEGGGLTSPLAATGVFPRLAIGFLRTGEETSQLGLMLTRLADVLDSDVKIRLERLIGLLTPAITVILGGAVAAIIAAIMTAILGFNDLAVSG